MIIVPNLNTSKLRRSGMSTVTQTLIFPYPSVDP
jgi:hypothetical protein